MLRALGGVLGAPSQEELRVAARLHQLQQERACILGNLQLRQAQCKQQLEADAREAQRRRDDKQR